MFKLDLPTKTGSLGSARRVLERIGQDVPEFQHGICEEWHKVTTIWNQQERDSVAWATVRKYSTAQVEKMISDLWGMTSVLRGHTSGECQALGCEIDDKRIAQCGRLDYIKLASLSDANANSIAKGMCADLKSLIARCREALERPEAARARVIWLAKQDTDPLECARQPA